MRIALRDITLNFETVGQGRPLLLLHGFTGSAATWADHADCFAEYARAIAVDLIGHGDSDSPDDPERYLMERCVEDLIALLDALDVAHADVLGYSMGGRVALHLAAAAPDRVDRLILESGSPGLADPAERQARVAADEALAASIERSGLAAFVDRWERVPLFASQASLPAGARADLRAQRLQNNPLGLANSLRGMGTGRQASLWQRLPEIACPTLLLAGALDSKFSEFARSMAAVMPDARVEVVPGAGHAVHLEQPERFRQLVTQFCTEGRLK